MPEALKMPFDSDGVYRTLTRDRGRCASGGICTVQTMRRLRASVSAKFVRYSGANIGLKLDIFVWSESAKSGEPPKLPRLTE